MRVFIAVAVALTARAVLACSCITEPEPKTEFKSSDVVFFGEVVAVSETSAEMLVVEDFKGAPKDRIIVSTPPGGAACGYGFDGPGTRHLIYAWIDDKTGLPNVSLCSRSRPEAEASCDLRYLRKRAPWWRSPLSSVRLLRWMRIRRPACMRM